VSEDGEQRRTDLAVERTYLAWWRTGMTGYAVALAIARIVPDLAQTKVQWPYTLLGIGFAVLGTGCLVYGEHRRRAGGIEESSTTFTLILTVGGAVLGLALIALLAIAP
jgi:inner membrane protein YidH